MSRDWYTASINSPMPSACVPAGIRRSSGSSTLIRSRVPCRSCIGLSTDDEVYELLDDYSDLGDELLEIAAIIEKAHGIGGIDEV
jgi:hypothetical protein